MEPLTGAAHAALFVSPADAKVALPSIVWWLDAGTLLALAALLVALVPLLVVFRGTDATRGCDATSPRPRLMRRWATRIGVPEVVWRAVGARARVGPAEATGPGEGLAAVSPARALNDRG
jgi:hypothetical protein